MSQQKVEWAGDDFASIGDDLTAEIGRVRSGYGTMVYEVVIYRKGKPVEQQMSASLANAKKAAAALLRSQA